VRNEGVGFYSCSWCGFADDGNGRMGCCHAGAGYPAQSEWQHLVVNLPQARLFFIRMAMQKIYPVAVGKMLTQTPIGSYAITGVYRDPSWHVPKSIQEEQKNQGKPVLTVVPPGPDNPLGPVFIRFGEAKLGLGFHGTNAPASVPGFRSHGCIRLKTRMP
jgi:lipoprotein-anchoring transpeptidase ErfK/SrfK